MDFNAASAAWNDSSGLGRDEMKCGKNHVELSIIQKVFCGHCRANTELRRMTFALFEVVAGF